MAWADVGLPLRVQLRIQDPGWSWSGGVALEELGPGDLFVKVRQRLYAAGSAGLGGAGRGEEARNALGRRSPRATGHMP